MTSLWRLSIDYMYQFTKPLIGGNMLIFNIIPIKWHRCNFVWWQLISKRLFFNREIVEEMLWAKKSPLKLMIITAFDIYWDIKFSNRSEIWWALWQQCCRDISSIWVMCCSQYAVMHRIYIYIFQLTKHHKENPVPVVRMCCSQRTVPVQLWPVCLCWFPTPVRLWRPPSTRTGYPAWPYCRCTTEYYRPQGGPPAESIKNIKFENGGHFVWASIIMIEAQTKWPPFSN